MEKPEKIKKLKQDSSNYWRQLGRLEKLNKSSEFKAGVVFSFHSLIIGLFVDKIDYFRILLSENIFVMVLVILWAVSVVISVYYAFRCFKPIIINFDYEDNVFFFGDVISKFTDIESYVKTINDITEDREKLFVQLAQQVHVESVIVAAKFKNVQKAIFYFMVSVVLIALSLIAIFIL